MVSREKRLSTKWRAFLGQRRGAGMSGRAAEVGRRDGGLKTYWAEPRDYSALWALNRLGDFVGAPVGPCMPLNCGAGWRVHGSEAGPVKRLLVKCRLTGAV
jgi:hypothetical protein